MIRFSVIMPVFNREQYVRQAVDSVLSQTFRDFELIVVDDGSTDGSVEMLKSYGDQIRLIEQKNSGPEVARNKGAEIARGKYIALLDSDDILFRNALETYDQVIRAFDSPPLIVGAHTFYHDGDPLPELDQGTEPTEVIACHDYLSKNVPLAAICSLHVVLKSVWEQAGGFRNSDSQTWWGDTFDFLLRIGTRGPCIIVKRPNTVVYRLHTANSIKSLKPHAEGMLRIAGSELAGAYPGGWRRRWDRFAFIGGISVSWAVYYCWRGGERKLALRLIAGTAPMILAAVIKLAARKFRNPPPTLVLPSAAARTGPQPTISSSADSSSLA